jgi:hypothetical protein
MPVGFHKAIVRRPALARVDDGSHRPRMRTPILPALLLALPAAGSAQSTPPVRWAVTSTVVDLTVPGTPGFLLKMAKGKSRTEHKCVPAGHSMAALLEPDPKSQCRVDSQQFADGRYTQALTCTQRSGEPMKASRVGTYDANGFAGRLEMTGQSPKGAVRMVLDQRAARAPGKCGG